jgi:DNA-binding NarL/FixJ family response regulator
MAQPRHTAKSLETPAGVGHQRPPAPVDERRLRVLIADDHPLYARTVARILGAHEWIEIVGFAENGREAVDLAASLRPDIVLADLHMPVMDGVEAMRLIREHSPIPVVILTSSDAPADVSRALAAGASAFLSKLVSPVELVERVDEAARPVEAAV